jgi:hypothetical protein
MSIFILWFQGFNHAPPIVKKCVQSWKHYNPEWNIVLLDKHNLSQYIDVHLNKNMMLCHQADLIRILLLKKYGGVWADATTFCNRPLHDWLPKENFFAFYNSTGKTMISSWFLYAKKNDYIIDKWCEATLNYCKHHEKAHTYFFFHYLFEDLYNSNSTFKTTWDKVKKISSYGKENAHYIQDLGLCSTPTRKIKKHIDSKSAPVYKLTYKHSLKKCTRKKLLHYLYSTIHQN